MIWSSEPELNEAGTVYPADTLNSKLATLKLGGTLQYLLHFSLSINQTSLLVLLESLYNKQAGGKASCGLYLQVVLRVPVGVKDDAGICCSQIDAKSSGSRAQQEDKAVRVWSGKPVDGGLPQVTTNSAVYTFIGISGTQGGRTRGMCQKHNQHGISLCC